jgi:hypothetical protein
MIRATGPFRRVSSLLLVIATVSATCLLGGDLLAGMCADFELVIDRYGRTDRSTGMAFFDLDSTLNLRVESPLNQWMVFRKDTLVIYYPETQSGFRIPSIQGDVALPAFQLLVNATKEDVGLVALGYELIDYRKQHDTLVAIWHPRQLSNRPALADMEVLYVDSEVRQLSIRGRDGGSTLIEYSGFVNLGSVRFPRRVTMTRSELDGQHYMEAMTLGEIDSSCEFAAGVSNPIIPKDADIELIELWSESD